MSGFRLLLLASLLGSPAMAGKQPPKVFIDEGACPFECCTYREWTVEKDTDLFDKVGGKKKVGKALKGTKVTGVTGEVHTVPLRMTGNDGKVFYLLTYQGEGFWKIWKDGAVESDVGQDWVSEQRPQSTWWVLIKLKNGTKGWTSKPGNFGNVDACG